MKNGLSKRYGAFLTEFGGDKWRTADLETVIEDFKGRVVESYPEIKGTPLHKIALDDIRKVGKMNSVQRIVEYVAERMLVMEGE